MHTIYIFYKPTKIAWALKHNSFCQKDFTRKMISYDERRASAWRTEKFYSPSELALTLTLHLSLLLIIHINKTVTEPVLWQKWWVCVMHILIINWCEVWRRNKKFQAAKWTFEGWRSFRNGVSRVAFYDLLSVSKNAYAVMDMCKGDRKLTDAW